MLESSQQVVRMSLFLKTHFTFQPLIFTTTLLTTPVALPTPLEDSPLFQVYQQCMKITTDFNSLLPHRSIVSTEVSELPIVLRKGTRSYTQQRKS